MFINKNLKLLLAFLIVFGALGIVFASDGSPTISTDKADYAPGETVLISGTGFASGTQYLIKVTRPDNTSSTGNDPLTRWPTDYDYVVADDNGNFQYNYVLDGITGEYLVEVFDSENNVLATHTFTDTRPTFSVIIGTINGNSYPPSPPPLTNPIHLTGTTSSTNFPGHLNQYQVQVDWGDGTVDSDSTVNFVQSGNDFSGTWSSDPDHNYAAGGSYTITVKLYHEKIPGAESGDSMAQATIEVAPPVPTQGTLIVIKHVVNDNGGTASAGDFTIQVTATNPSDDSFPGAESPGTTITVNAGSYSVSETGLSGYSQSASADCSSTIAAGQTKTCTIINDDIAPKLTVTKVVTNNNGGTKVVANFPLFVDTTLVTSGVQNGFNAGAHTVSETTDSGYTSVISGGCAADGTITLNLGDIKSCTITNDDKSGTLIVKKVVINNNGGSLNADAFNFQVNGGNAVSFEADGQNDLTVNAGTYSVTEPAVSGYTTTYNNCNQVVIPNGGSATCTITNDDQQAYIIVDKIVVNNNGGSATANQFLLTVDGNAVSDGVAYAVNPGAHTAGETNLPGYIAGTWGGDCSSQGSVTVALGQTKTCTITNDDQQAYITVTKIVTNDNGGSAAPNDFLLTLEGSSVSSGVQVPVNPGTYTAAETLLSGYLFEGFTGDCDLNGDVTVALGESKTCTLTNNDIRPKLTVTKVVINHGGNKQISDFPLFVDVMSVTSGVQNGFNAGAHTVSETTDSGYTSLITGDCASNGAITLNIGDVKSCTITNEEIKPKLTVTKVVINHGGVAVVADFPLFVDQSGITSGNQNEFDSGIHTVSETTDSGYTSTITGDCNADGTITLSSAAVKTCTITNEEIKPKLTVTKIIINDNGGTKQVSDFPLFVGQSGVTSGNQNEFDSGVYTVSETTNFGYTSTISGDCAPDGTITLNSANVKSCTITNDDLAPSLTLVKDIVKDNGGTAVATDWTVSAAGPTPISGAGGAVSDASFDQGTYTLSESGGPSGYTASSWVCVGGSQDGSSITLGLGESATCTITNDDQPVTLTVIKHVVNDNGGNKLASAWTMTVTGNNVLPSSTFPGDESGTIVTLDANAPYSVTETGPTGYSESDSADCSSTGLAPGATATCTITNDDIAPKLTLVKTVVNNDGGTKVVSNFQLFINAASVTSGVENTLAANVLYTATETTDSGYTPSVWGGDCNSDGTITLQPGDVKTCTITNDDKPGTLIVIKHVINDNLGTKTAGDFSMTVTGTNVQPSATFAGAESPGTTVTLNAGSYSVDETSVFGYAKTLGANCSGTIANGETKTCTITNDDIQPVLHVIKHVVNGAATASQFTIAVTGNSPSPASFFGAESPGTTVTLNAGAYNVAETSGPAGYFPTYVNDCSGSMSVGDEKTCTINNAIPVTRTQGFWQTHTAFTTNIFTNQLGSSILIGDGSTHKGPVNNVNKLFGAYYSNIPKKVDGSKRQSIDQARMQLLQQLVTAKLNCAAFGCPTSIQTLISQADTAYAGNNAATILSYVSQLDAYNNLGDSRPIPGTLPNPGSATPKNSQTLANKGFWDTP